ncbi:MAG: sigma-70 family RNA polymerase sigma factor [Akkermansiaceae bacterium]|nr:sigma-70 family RNA polymerase sigma factor [Akkermansiaceae bacterium]MCF7732619.1 sigma-70 family RNA polymerase sigma factor [Akkermansiaceae bacterium]
MNRPAPTTPTPPAPLFLTTHWSVVADACDPEGPEAVAALEELCGSYWMPLYLAVRRFGHSPEGSEDLTQEFFARLLEKGWLRAADREKGRFRTFLMVALKRFLANEWHRERTARRGGGFDAVPLDTELAERLYAGSGSHLLSPEQLFDKRWALTLIETALVRMEGEYDEAGRGGEFALLKPCLTAGRGGIDYRELAAALGLGEGAARVAVHRIRKRFRSLFREEIARTVRDEAEVEEEMRALMAALGT